MVQARWHAPSVCTKAPRGAFSTNLSGEFAPPALSIFSLAVPPSLSSSSLSDRAVHHIHRLLCLQRCSGERHNTRRCRHIIQVQEMTERAATTMQNTSAANHPKMRVKNQERQKSKQDPSTQSPATTASTIDVSALLAQPGRQDFCAIRPMSVGEC